MSLFQCEECGCMENTATGWYWCRNDKQLTPEKYLGKALCSCCAPTEYAGGDNNENNTGEWHGRFDRKFFEKGALITNGDGNLEYKDTGETATLSGGSDTEL